MDALLNASIDELVGVFNDEMKVFLNQLITIGKQVKMQKSDFESVINSKKKLLQVLEVNNLICIDTYATFLLTDKYSDFFEHVQKRDHDYLYKLAMEEERNNEFQQLMVMIRMVSYNVDKETKNDVLGYVENLSILANVYAKKKLET